MTAEPRETPGQPAPKRRVEALTPTAPHAPAPYRAARLSPRRRRQRRIQRLLGLGLIPLVLLGSGLLFARAALDTEHLTALVQGALARELAVEVEIGRVEYGFPDEVRLRDLRIGSPPGSRFPELLAVPGAEGRLRLLPLIFGSIEVESLEVSGVDIFVERDELGVFRVLQAFRPRETAPSETSEEDRATLIDWRPPSVTVKEVRVWTCPETVFEIEEPIVIPEVLVRNRREDRDAFTITAETRIADLATIRLDGSGDLRRGDLRTTLQVERLRVDASFRSRLPRSLRAIWDEYQPSGTAEVSHRLMVTGGKTVENSGEVTLSDASMRLRDPRIAIDRVRGTVRVDPRRVTIEDALRGEAFGGTAEVRGSIELTPEGPAGNSVEIRLSKIELGPKVRDALPEPARRGWDRYSPEGSASLTLTARGDSFPPADFYTILDLHSVAARYSEIPYPISGLSGSIHVDRGELRVDVVGGTAPRVSVKATGNLQNADAPQEVEVQLEGITIDGEVMAALPADIRREVERFDPGGLLDLLILVRSEPGGPFRPTIQLTARDLDIAHEAFPVRVDRLTGVVVFDENGVRFDGIRGRHAGAVVALEKGEIVYGAQGHIDLEIHAPELPFGASVVAAFSEELREVVETFGPGTSRVGTDGKLDTHVFLRSKGSAPLDVLVTAEIRAPLEIRYEDFPYPLLFEQGTVIYDSAADLLRFDSLRTSPLQGGEEGNEGPRVLVTGEQSHPDEGDPDRWLLAIELKILLGQDERGLEVSDPTLVESLPADLREFAERMDLSGQVFGSVGVHSWTGGSAPDVVEYVGGIDLLDGAVDFGLRLYDIDAHFEVHGGLDGERPHHFSGSLDRGSYRFSRFRVDVTRPTSFVYGELHPEIQYLTNAERDENSRYRPSNFFLESLLDADVTKTFQASLGPAALFGGTLDGFFFADLKEGGSFGGEAEAEGILLEEGGEDLFGTKDTAGTAYGALQLRGATDDVDSLIGLGYAGIRDGRLTKIPALAAIILNPLQGFSKENLHFEKATVKRYRVADRRIVIDDWDDFVLESPIINLKGRGTLGFDSELDLILEPQTLGGLPILSDLVNTLTRFRLSGSLDDPEIEGDFEPPPEEDP